MARDRSRDDAGGTPRNDFRLDWPSGGESSETVTDTDLRLAWGNEDERPPASVPAVEPEAVETHPAEPTREPTPTPRPESESESAPVRPTPLASDAPLVRLRTRGSAAGITTDDHTACRQEIERLQAEVEVLRAEVSALQAPAEKRSDRTPGRLRGRP